MARKPPEEPSGGGEWLNTYADMVTLLLTFFIMLFSMSSISTEKFNLIVQAIKGESSVEDQLIMISETGEYTVDVDQIAEAVGPDELDPEMPLNLSALLEQIQQQIEASDREDSVRAIEGEGYIFIQFMDNMFFEPNSARLLPDDLEILNFVGRTIKSVESQLEVVRVDGHTAAIPENPDYPVSDRILSADRSNAVLTYFEDVVGIDGALLQQLGFGKWNPLPGNDNSTPEMRSQNRRVELLISTHDDIEEDLRNIYENLVEE